MPTNEERARRRVYDLNRYHERRRRAIASLGGKCVVCGTEDSLELDHIDPSTKSFNISEAWGKSESVWWAEVEKCQLLCITHHKKKTAKEQTKGHGTWGSVRNRKCKCDECREFVRDYHREWRARKSSK